MSSVPRSLTTGLTVAAIVLVPAVLGQRIVAEQGAASSSMTDRARIVGTYELVTTETKDPATGRWSPTPNYNSNGYIIQRLILTPVPAKGGGNDKATTRLVWQRMLDAPLTPEKKRFIGFMNKEGRVPYAGAQPTPDEALAAYRSYSGYFGRFVTYENHNPPFVYHSQQGSTNPGGYSEQQRFYRFTGNVLRLGGPPNLNDNGELAGGHLYWERVSGRV